ncbi:MAG: peroxiredoxin [Ferrovum sp.]|nr:peroxiredoxin [Ferrovum sp.]NDU87285.1 peroxiredoxin [Ferrovum sp.]
MLSVGELAPSFELPDSEMAMVSLEGYRGQWIVVLFFYPRDGSPQCTEEAIGFSDHEDDFRKLGAKIVGVSRDDVLCHADFCEAHGLNARLLADVEGEVCQRYDVLHEKETAGFKRAYVDRVTYVIDLQGVVRFAVPVTNSRDHVVEVLNLVKELGKL